MARTLALDAKLDLARIDLERQRRLYAGGDRISSVGIDDIELFSRLILVGESQGVGCEIIVPWANGQQTVDMSIQAIAANGPSQPSDVFSIANAGGRRYGEWSLNWLEHMWPHPFELKHYIMIARGDSLVLKASTQCAVLLVGVERRPVER